MTDLLKSTKTIQTDTSEFRNLVKTEKSNRFSLLNKCLDCLRRPAFRRTQLTLHCTQLCSFCLERLRYTTEACSTDKKHYKTYRNFLSSMWARYAFCIRTNSFLCNMHVSIQAVIIVKKICQLRRKFLGFFLFSH